VYYWCILSYFFFTRIFLLVSIALTVSDTLTGCLCDFRVGWINLRISGTALKSRCSGYSGSSMPLACAISESTSAMQSSSLSFRLSKSPFQLCQSSVSQTVPGVLSYSHLTGSRLILQIWLTFNLWVRPPGRSFADKDGGKGDLSDNLNAATPSCWKSDQDALTISSVSEIYPTAVICLLGAQDSFWVACRFWLPCHGPQKLWTLAILCNLHSSASFSISELFCGFIVSISGLAPATIPLLAQGYCLATTFSWKGSPVVCDCL